MSDLKRLVSGSVLKTVNLFITVVVSFLMMPFVIHALGDKWYGVWVIIGTFIGYYTYMDFGLSSASQRFVARALHSRADGDVNTVVSSAFAIFLVLSLISLLVTGLVILSVPLFVDSPDDYAIFQIVIAILGLKTALMFPLMVYNGVLTAYLRYDIDSYINIAKLLIKTLLVVVYLTLGYSIIALAVITLITELMGYIAVMIWAYRIHPSLRLSRRKVDTSLFGKLFNYSKFTFIVRLGDILRFQIDNLVIGQFVGLVAVTHYAVAIRLMEYITELLNSILGGFLPVFTKYDAQEAHEEFAQKFMLVTEVSVFLTLLFIPTIMIVASEFISIWLGENYTDAYIPLLILGVASIVAGMNRSGITVLYAKAEHHYYARVNILEGIANLALSIILVQRYGIIGVALGTAIPTLLVKIYLVPKQVCRLLDMPLRLYYRLMLKYTLFAGLYYTLLTLAYQYVKAENYWDLIWLCVTAGGLYVLICLKLVLSAPVKAYIRTFIPEKYRRYSALLF